MGYHPSLDWVDKEATSRVENAGEVRGHEESIETKRQRRKCSALLS